MATEKKAKRVNGESDSVAIKALNHCFQIQFQTWQDMSELQLRYADLLQECANDSFQRMFSAKSVTDLLATEYGLAAEYFTKFSEEALRSIETLSKSQQQLLECLNQSGNWCNDFSKEMETSATVETGQRSRQRTQIV